LQTYGLSAQNNLVYLNFIILEWTACSIVVVGSGLAFPGHG